MQTFAALSGARALRTHRILMRIALGTSIFGWVLMFQIFLSRFGFEHALFSILILYTFSQVLAFFLTPLSAPALRFGVRRALAFGTLAASFMMVALALMFAPENAVSFFTLLSAFVVFSALHRALYWVPYESLASEIPRTSLPEIMLMCVPLIAGVLFAVPGLGVFVYSGASIAALLALIPLTQVPERVEAFEWSIGETLRALFARRNHMLLMRGVLDGVQGVGLLLLWPITIFTIIRGDWFLFGLILSLSLLITFFLRSRVQSILKRMRADRSDTLLACIALSAWGARLVSPAPLAIISVDVFAGTTISPKRFSIDSYSGEQYADGGHFIDEYTALKEMALHLGRILACLICIALVPFSAPVAIAAGFLCAGCASAASVILARRAARAL